LTDQVRWWKGACWCGTGKLTSHDEESIVEDGNECARRILTDAGRAASIVV
jgi:hypothetical protein